MATTEEITAAVALQVARSEAKQHAEQIANLDRQIVKLQERRDIYVGLLALAKAAVDKGKTP